MDLYRKIAGAVFVTAVLLAGAKTSPAAGTGGGASQIRGKRRVPCGEC